MGTEGEEAEESEQRHRERVQNLLSSYYGTSSPGASARSAESAGAQLDLDSSGFDSDAYVQRLTRSEPLPGLQDAYADLVHSIQVPPSSPSARATRSLPSQPLPAPAVP
jgi:hypothetical protein